MPIYEYLCPKCHTKTEEWQKTHDVETIICPKCSAIAERIMSNTSFVLKGAGWYVTDYSNKATSCAPSSNKIAETATKNTSSEVSSTNNSDKTQP